MLHAMHNSKMGKKKKTMDGSEGGHYINSDSVTPKSKLPSKPAGYPKSLGFHLGFEGGWYDKGKRGSGPASAFKGLKKPPTGKGPKQRNAPAKHSL